MGNHFSISIDPNLLQKVGKDNRHRNLLDERTNLQGRLLGLRIFHRSGSVFLCALTVP